MSRVVDYNELFRDFDKLCVEENVSNAFGCISLGELQELNALLDRLLIFCENIDEEILEDCECGDKIMELYRLVDTLFDRDYQTKYEKDVATDNSPDKNSDEIPEVKSLRWIANNFPYEENPKDDTDKLTNCIHLYCTAGANKIEELAKALAQFK